jgi:hypothetical protein
MTEVRLEAKPLRFTAHSARVVAERRIREDWIEHAIQSPLETEPDPTQAGAVRVYARVAEFGNRVLRVVYFDEGERWRIITVFFDRGWVKRKRKS